MDVLVGGERSGKGLVFGEMGEEAKLDLRVVGAEDAVGLFGRGSFLVDWREAIDDN